MPSLNWLGRAQNKNVLKTIFLYGSSLSVLPKVMNHWVNQTGILWFLICLPLISWVACRDLIWDCLPFLYGSMEGQCGERWGRAWKFSCCSARSCSAERKVQIPHLCSSLLFYSTLFLSFLLKSPVTCLFSPIPYLLTVSIPHTMGAVWERRSLEMKGDSLQPPRKQRQQLEGLPATSALGQAALPVSRVCQHPSRSLWWPQAHWCWAAGGAGVTRFLPPLPRMHPAAEGQLCRAGGSDISSTADVCSVDMSQSLISRLFVISVALL